jgi:hypothetical protein
MPIALSSLFNPKPSRAQTIFWLSLSLTIAALYAGICLQQAFSGDYVAQDDTRQHVFWMRRFFDPELFPNDLIADYFQSVAPAGYTALYRLMALVGVDPIVFSKILPFVLGLVMTAYCFGVTVQLLPLPVAGFMASLLLNQSVWMKYDVASGTPRAFAFPLLLAFCYYLLRRSWLPYLASIALLGLFYPHMLLVAIGVLLLQPLRWQAGRWRLVTERSDYRFWAAGLGVAIAVLLPYAVGSSQFSPAVTAAVARTMPEFQAGGRTPFFDPDPIEFWLTSRGSGFFPRQMPLPIQIGWLLPLLFWLPDRLPLIRSVTPKVVLLLQLLLASLGVFLVAHLLLFRLHVPNRYTGTSLRILLAIAAAIVIVTLLEALVRWANTRDRGRVAWGVSLLTLVLLVAYPATLETFPNPRYVVGTEPALYEFYAQQPKDVLTASIAAEADNLPTFAQRSVLTGREYGVPYQLGYYEPIRERAIAVIDAQYSARLDDVKAVIQTYGVDFWLVDREAFTREYVRKHGWLRNFPAARDQALKRLDANQPALAKVSDRCQAIATDKIIVLRADCLAKSPHPA